jgi:hypothetical protein
MPYTNASRPREGRGPAHLEVQQMTTERNPEMSRNRSFEKRAREEVERIKAREATEEEPGDGLDIRKLVGGVPKGDPSKEYNWD